MTEPHSLIQSRHPQVGYFVCDTQPEPEYDPPYDGPCLVCWLPLAPDDVRTISLMPRDRAVASVFFRVHRTCAHHSPEAVEAIEHRIIEGEFALSDERFSRPCSSCGRDCCEPDTCCYGEGCPTSGGLL